MVFFAGLVGSVCLGLGWVLQQRVAAQAALSEMLSFRLLLHLMTHRTWLFGIGAMAAGAALGGWALQLGSVALVEPLLTANLLFAFIFAAWLNRSRPDVHEIAGAVLLSAAVGVFIGIGHPSSTDDPQWTRSTSALAIGVTAAVAFALVVAAKRRRLIIESTLIATAAGVMYGLQDMSTRATFLAIDRHGWAGAFTGIWPYVVFGAAIFGILFSQSAFRAARLDYSLPPTSVTEPLVGIALGITVLGDRLSVSPGALTAELLCLVAMVAGVVLIGRSNSLQEACTVVEKQPSDVGSAAE
jgi:drug/metabolite transporter (DMT)-like permease